MLRVPLGVAGICAGFSDRYDGDMAMTRPGSESNRVQLLGRELGNWTWLNQVHSRDALLVLQPGQHCGMEADACVGEHPDSVLSVTTADCVPVIMGSSEGLMAAAHCGWRGLEAGILDTTVRLMASSGAKSIVAAVGPSICARCYEFSRTDLERVESCVGISLGGEDQAGRLTLDLAKGVNWILSRLGVDVVFLSDQCTACSGRYFSARANGDVERQVSAVWRDMDKV